MFDDRFYAPRSRDRIEAHQEEAARLRELAKEATTPAIRLQLKSRAQEHTDLAKAEMAPTG